jgi:hypothetical protein
VAPSRRSGTDTAAFALEINPDSGEVTVEQYVSLYHPDDLDHNDPVDLSEADLAVQVSVIDGDGDTAGGQEGAVGPGPDGRDQPVQH